MSQLLELSQDAKPLLAAYDAMKQQTVATDGGDLVAIYEQHFVTAVPPASTEAPSFERVSLTDPTIRTIIRASTAP